MHDDLRKIQHSNDFNVLPLITADIWSSVNMCDCIFWRFCLESTSPLLFLSIFISTSSCHHTWVWHNSCKSSTTQSYQSAVFLCVQIMVWLPVCGIFSACRHGDACCCTQRSADTIIEYTGSWLWEKISLPHQVLEPTPVLCLDFQSNCLPTELSQAQFFSLWEKHVPATLGFLHGILVVTLWLVEVLRWLAAQNPAL